MERITLRFATSTFIFSIHVLVNIIYNQWKQPHYIPSSSWERVSLSRVTQSKVLSGQLFPEFLFGYVTVPLLISQVSDVSTDYIKWIINMCDVPKIKSTSSVSITKSFFSQSPKLIWSGMLSKKTITYVFSVKNGLLGMLHAPQVIWPSNK